MDVGIWRLGVWILALMIFVFGLYAHVCFSFFFIFFGAVFDLIGGGWISHILFHFGEREVGEECCGEEMGEILIW